MEKKELMFSSLCIHGASQLQSKDARPLVPAICQSTSYVFESIEDGKNKCESSDYGHCYTRVSNPTNSALEEKMAVIEGGESALAFSSGVGAISGVLFMALKSGDHVIADETLYSAAYYLFDTMLRKFGVEITFMDTGNIEKLKCKIKPNTVLVYCESPANPTMKVIDIAALSEVCKSNNIISVVDGTFASPYCCHPIQLGIDVVIHSTTKYICGHGDAIGGIVISTKKFIDKLRDVSLKNLGACPAPMNSFLMLRGIKTLPIRMERHCENAMKVAEFLECHPKINEVRYPGLESHPQHEIAKRTMSGFGGVLCFDLKGGVEEGIKFMESLNLCTLAVSLGDVETLVEHPASMTHWYINRDERIKAGITDGLIRMSLGLEHYNDIIEDLKQALEQI